LTKHTAGPLRVASTLTYDDGVNPGLPRMAKRLGGGDSRQRAVVRDAQGNTLVDGDGVAVIKDLKVQFSSSRSCF